MKYMKRILALVLALMLAMGAVSAFAASKTVKINKTNFPDKTFRAYVKKFDKDNNGKLSAKEIKAVKRIDISERPKIANLKGIEHFTALKYLYLNGAAVKKLDVSKNTELRELDAVESSLTSLKLGKQKKLYRLDLTYVRNLKKVDIGSCPKLIDIVKNVDYIIYEDNDVTFVAGQDWMVSIDRNAKLMNGKKVLRQYKKPTSLKFTKKSLSLKKGDYYSLWSIMKLNPSTAFYPLTFTSSDKKIATVSDGGIEALKKGTTTITVKAGKKKLGSIKVTVKK